VTNPGPERTDLAPPERDGAGPPAATVEWHELIVTTSLADEIAFRLQSAIIDGTFLPGEHLRQEEICHKFKVSRTPVREALRKLQAQNLVLMTPNKGATVRFPTRNDIREIYIMRAELEGFACELAAGSQIPDAAFRDLEGAQALVETATTDLEHRPTDVERGYYFLPLARANDRFHEAIHRLTGNQRLCATLIELQNAFPKDLVWRAMHSLNENRAFVISEHEAVLEALRRHHGSQARKTMAQHVTRAGNVLLAYLDEREFWKR
jgi:DNA-binding GntR family transcriptional regulator